MNLSIIGHGYVGLVSAAVFADLGNSVWCVGRTPEKIENLKKGIMPFYEPGLDEVVKRNINAGRLKFTTNYQEAIPLSDIVFICVGTPPLENGQADLSQVEKAALEIAKNIEDYTVVVTKSTVPIGTNKIVQKIVSQHKKKEAVFDVASCPEFLREGSALSDTMNPDRIVIGAESDKEKNLLLELHKPIAGKTIITSIETAEMIKYAANSLLSVKISFANAISFLCEETGADVEGVMEGIGSDKRIGRRFLYPGVGYGGSCFPKDVKALISISDALGYNFKLLKETEEINKQASIRFIDKAVKLLKGKVKGKTIGVLGLSFKPNTDDMREAPAIKIISSLQKMGAKIKTFDPIAISNASKILTNVEYNKDPYETAEDADLLLIVTEWNEFRQLNLPKIKKLMKSPIILDGRNIYDPEKIRKLGFIYQGIGRK